MDLRACLVTATSLGENGVPRGISAKFDWFETGRNSWLRGDDKLASVKCIQYGEQWEDTARDNYQSWKQKHASECVHIAEVGIVIHRDGVLGASPDGIVTMGDEKGIVEIKCPSGSFFRTNRGWPVLDLIEAGPDTIPLWCQRWITGCNLKDVHKAYYRQCIVNMHLNGATWADFVVWHPGQQWGVRAAGSATFMGRTFGVERIEADDETEVEYRAIVKGAATAYDAHAALFGQNRAQFIQLYDDPELRHLLGAQSRKRKLVEQLLA